METTRDERPPEMRGIRMRAARDAFRPFIRVARLNGALQFANLAKPDSFIQTDRETHLSTLTLRPTSKLLTTYMVLMHLLSMTPSRKTWPCYFSKSIKRLCFAVGLLYVEVQRRRVKHTAEMLLQGAAWRFARYDTIQYDIVYLMCSKKLTCSQLSPPHGTNTTRGQSNLTKSASRGVHSPVRGHPGGSKVVPLNSWGRVSY